MAAARQGSASKLPLLPVPYKSDSPRTSQNDGQLVPRAYAGPSRLDMLEERLISQEKTTQNLVDRAYKIKEDIIDNLNFTHGSWQDERHARELLQEHIRTITEVVRKLNRDIQVLEDQIRNKEGYVEGTSNAVKNLEVHHVAGLTDLRGRVARCDASISRLSGDLKSCHDSIKVLSQQQVDSQSRVFQRIQDLEGKMTDLMTRLERSNMESSIHLQQVEGGSSQQISKVESKTMSKIDETKKKVKDLKAQEATEREKLEVKINSHLDQAVARMNTKLDQLEKRVDEIARGLAAQVEQLEQQLSLQMDSTTSSQQVLEGKMNNSINSNIKQQQSEIARLKRECREGFGTVHETISNMKQVTDGKRKLLEEELRKEIGQIRRMVVLI